MELEAQVGEFDSLEAAEVSLGSGQSGQRGKDILQNQLSVFLIAREHLHHRQ